MRWIRNRRRIDPQPAIRKDTGMSEPGGFNLKRASGPLPQAKDFDPFDGDLDARWAWKNVGGLSLDQAYELLLSNPIYYQEAFMWMGPKAFAYYLPVIDRYLREFRNFDEMEDCGWILGRDVANQLERLDSESPASIIGELKDLATFVLSNLGNFTPDLDEQKRIQEAWLEVSQLAAGLPRS
jgi:hypothetical protein